MLGLDELGGHHARAGAANAVASAGGGADGADNGSGASGGDASGGGASGDDAACAPLAADGASDELALASGRTRTELHALRCDASRARRRLEGYYGGREMLVRSFSLQPGEERHVASPRPSSRNNTRLLLCRAPP